MATGWRCTASGNRCPGWVGASGAPGADPRRASLDPTGLWKCLRAALPRAALAILNDMAGLTWEQIDNIALELYDTRPDVDPLTVRFTDLHKWITELPGFSDDPAKSSEGKLEAIQMAWLEEYQDNQ